MAATVGDVGRSRQAFRRIAPTAEPAGTRRPLTYMGQNSTPNDHPYDAAPHPQYDPARGPLAPLPPSRRQRDTSVQWVVLVVTLIVTIVVVAVLMSVRPSKNVTPAPRAPSTYSQQDCDYQYIPCPTTRWPR